VLSLRLCQTQLNLDRFKQHIKKLKDLIDTVQVKILNYAEQDNAVFTKHLVSSTLKDGSKHTHKVFAEFIVKDGKIRYCDELTSLVDGLMQANIWTRLCNFVNDRPFYCKDLKL